MAADGRRLSGTQGKIELLFFKPDLFHSSSR
jgi:hypothetical protein